VTAFVATVVAVVAVGFRGRTTPLASLIITVGIALLAEAVLLAAFGEVPRSYSAVSDRAWDIGGVLVQPQYAVLAVVALLAALGLTLFLRKTIVGHALVASADSPRAAELIGLNLRSVAVIAFAIAGALTAVGGLLLAPTVPVTYNADLAITINGFAAAVFGGLTSIRLALLGGYALGIVEQLVVGYVDPQYNLIIALTVMLVLIGWRSRGELAV
jgi:branched-chain amino acid transport system permease protein